MSIFLLFSCFFPPGAIAPFPPQTTDSLEVTDIIKKSTFFFSGRNSGVSPSFENVTGTTFLLFLCCYVEAQASMFSVGWVITMLAVYFKYFRHYSAPPPPPVNCLPPGTTKQ